MAGKLSIDLSLNAKGYADGAKEASYATKTLKQDTQAYLKEYGTLNRQMRTASMEARNLAAQFSALSDVEKNSNIGRSLELQMNQAIQKAGSLKDILQDTNDRISAAASDTSGLDATIMAFEGAAAAASVYTGALSLLGIENENLEEQFAKVQGALTLLNGVQSVANVLNENSVLIGKIKDLQTKARTAYLLAETGATSAETTAETANTVATGANTVAKTTNTASNAANTASNVANTAAVAVNTTAVAANATALGGATIAQKAFNLVAKANPYVLLAGAVTAVVGALYAFSKGSKDAKISEEQLNRELKYTQDEMQGIEDQADFDVAIAQAANKSASEIYKIRLEAKRAKQALAELGLSRATERYFNGEVDKSEIDKWQEEVNKAFQDTNKTIMDNYRQTQIDKVKKLHSKGGSKSGGGRTTNKPDKQDKPFDFTGAFEKNINKNSDALTKFVNDSQEALARLKQTWDDIFSDNKQSTYEQYVPSQNNTTTLNGIKAEMDANDQMIAKLKEVRAEYEKLGDITAVNQITAQIEGLVKANTDLGQSAQNMIEHQKKLAENAQIAAEQQENFEAQQEKLNQYKDAISNIGAAFGGLGSAIGDSTGKIMEFAGQALQTAANILPTIVQLIAAKQAESLASGTASAAKLPFPANVAAIASIVAQIMALFASFPKFESGGVISGSSFHGDNVIARVNSGEMIINKRQQSNLFNAIDKNKLSGTSNIQIGGVIRGTDILLVAKNQNNINKLSGTNIHF